MIIGSMPFMGVSYQSKAKDTQYFQEIASNCDAIKIIYDKAISLGLTKFAASPFPEQLAKNHISELIKLGDNHQIEVFPNVSIPIGLQNKPIDVYRRWATVYRSYKDLPDHNLSKEAILQNFLTDPILQFRPNWKDNLSAAVTEESWYSSNEIDSLHLFTNDIESKLSKLDKLPMNEVEYGSELDFIFATGRVDLVGQLIDLANAAGYDVAFGIHHAGISFPKIRSYSPTINNILTPINPKGIMMFPTSSLALSEILAMKGKYQIIGIKCLAGGRVHPQTAFEYLKNKIDDFMIGVASISELETAYEIAKKMDLPL